MMILDLNEKVHKYGWRFKLLSMHELRNNIFFAALNQTDDITLIDDNTSRVKRKS